MATNEPINEQALTKIRELLADDGRQWDDYSPQELYRVGWSAELLLAEVDRLRAREQALAAENAAMRLIVEAVAEAEAEPMQLYASEEDTVYVAELAASEGWQDEAISVRLPRDTYEQARAFVAAHPCARSTTPGEAERVATEQPVLRVLVSYACDRGDHERCNALASGCMCSCHAPQPPESEGE